MPEDKTLSAEPSASSTPQPVLASLAKPVAVAKPKRDPTEPIGTPPGGGSWEWDATTEKWVQLDEEVQPAEGGPATYPADHPDAPQE